MAAQPENNYTKPELREALKKKVVKSSKGGRPGQWSARKAQILVHEYEEAGGGYKSKKRTASQKHLEAWGDEKWQTASGEKAIQGEETHRYLPEKAWSKLKPEEKKATDRKKVKASRKGQQFVANTETAKKARKAATASGSKKTAARAPTKRSPATRKKTAPGQAKKKAPAKK